MAQVSFTPIALNAPKDRSVINAIFTAFQAGINSVDSTQVATGAVGSAQLASNAVTTVKVTDANITKAKLATDALQAFPQLVTPATIKMNWGTATGNLNSASGHSKYQVTVTHGLGATPAIVLAVGNGTAAITEDGGGIAHAYWVSTFTYTSTQFTALVEIAGTSNNAAPIVWLALG